MTRSRKLDEFNALARSGDASAILASIGLVPYDWRIDCDSLTWGANVSDVLQIEDLARAS